MTDVIISVLPLAPIQRIIRNAGAERVSEDAGIELSNTLENIGLSISREAVTFAKYAGRTTVKGNDIKLATSRIMK